MCLIVGKEDQRCMHKRCWEFKHYPQYYSNTRLKAINERTDFEWFKRQKRGKGAFILPVNPYGSGTHARTEFNKFSKGTYLETFGDWPNEWNLFHRSEISIQFVQYAAFKYVFNQEKKRSEKKWYLDVKEAACYVGSIEVSSEPEHNTEETTKTI